MTFQLIGCEAVAGDFVALHKRREIEKRDKEQKLTYEDVTDALVHDENDSPLAGSIPHGNDENAPTYHHQEEYPKHNPDEKINEKSKRSFTERAITIGRERTTETRSEYLENISLVRRPREERQQRFTC
jgi:hypothetical protein